jgi:hypothetical protein
MFRQPMADETKPASDETILRFGEDKWKPALGTKAASKRAAKANDRGPS